MAFYLKFYRIFIKISNTAHYNLGFRVNCCYWCIVYGFKRFSRTLRLWNICIFHCCLHCSFNFKKNRPKQKRPFKVPFVPLFPILGILLRRFNGLFIIHAWNKRHFIPVVGFNRHYNLFWLLL